MRLLTYFYSAFFIDFSGCETQNGEIRKKLVTAFINGYQKYLTLTISDIIKAIQLVWCIEAGWWIRESVFNEQENSKVLRFTEEINWVTENWFELEKILEG